MPKKWCEFTPEQKQRKIDAIDQWRRATIKKAKDFLGGECVFCGYKRCFRALEFHHVDPSEKDFGVSMQGGTRSWERVLREIKKCILVCANCHREIHDGIITQEMVEFSFKGSSMVEPTAVNRVVVSSTLTP